MIEVMMQQRTAARITGHRGNAEELCCWSVWEEVVNEESGTVAVEFPTEPVVTGVDVVG